MANAKKVAADTESDQSALIKAGTELSEKMMPIGAKMYEAAPKSEDAAKTPEAGETEDKKDDEPVEGEVVDKEK